jgi:predicted dehydrogenase
LVQTSDGQRSLECPAPGWFDDLSIAPGSEGLAIGRYLEENRAFVEAVVEGKEPSPGFHEAVTAHRLVDAVYRSAAACGAPVRLDGGEPEPPQEAPANPVD